MKLGAIALLIPVETIRSRVGPVIILAPEQFQTKYSDSGGRIKNGAVILLDSLPFPTDIL
jgi:hypothetical protein